MPSLFLMFYSLLFGLARFAMIVGLPTSIKILIMLLGVALIAFDYRKLRLRRRRLDRLTVLLVLFQVLLIVACLRAEIGDELTNALAPMAIIMGVVLPSLFVIAACVFDPDYSAFQGLNVYIGILMLIACSLILLLTPWGRDYTHLIYMTDRDSVSGGTRVALPLFSGGIIGGSVSGVLSGVSLLILLARFNTSLKIRIAAIAGTVIGALGVLITDVRSAALLVVICAILALSKSANYLIKPKRVYCIIGLGAFMMFPFVYRWASVFVYHFLPDWAVHAIGRRGADDIATLTGRVQMWELFDFTNFTPLQVLFGRGPFGEMDSGIYQLLTIAVKGTLDFGTVAHFHNLFLNFWYCYGLAGGVLLFLLVESFFERKPSASTCQAPYAYLKWLLFAYLLAGLTESMLSMMYLNTIPIFTAIVAELMLLHRRPLSLSSDGVRVKGGSRGLSSFRL